MVLAFFLDLHDWSFGFIFLAFYYVRYGVCRVGMILHAVYNYKGGCLLDTRTIDQDQRCLDGITSLLND